MFLIFACVCLVALCVSQSFAKQFAGLRVSLLVSREHCVYVFDGSVEFNCRENSCLSASLVFDHGITRAAMRNEHSFLSCVQCTSIAFVHIVLA